MINIVFVNWMNDCKCNREKLNEAVTRVELLRANFYIEQLEEERLSLLWLIDHLDKEKREEYNHDNGITRGGG